MRILTTIMEVLAYPVPTLLAIAFVAISKRKVWASMRRRVGPNISSIRFWVGFNINRMGELSGHVMMRADTHIERLLVTS